VRRVTWPRAALALLIAAGLAAEIYVVFVDRGGDFRIEGRDLFDISEFGSGQPVRHAFLMRGDGLNAVRLRFSSQIRSGVTVQWTLWRGHPDQPQDMTVAFEGTDQFELRPGRQWETLAFTRDASSRDRWYTIEARLLEVDHAPVKPGLNARPVALVASRDNPLRGGVLWIGDARQPGSLYMRAERQGRTLYRRFAAEAEPHLPPALKIPAIQWAIALSIHAALAILAFAIIGDATEQRRSSS
jgi:hypothetical protein